MFGKLKDRLKKTLSVFSKKTEEEVKEKPIVEKKEAIEEKEETVEEKVEEVKEEKPELEKEEIKEEPKEKVVEKPEEHKEKLNIFDEKGKLIGQETRGKIHQQGLLHQEIHVLVFNGKGEILFQKRSSGMETFPNLLDASVGGHVEIGEDYLSAAINEIQEELGLKINKDNLIFLADFKNKSRDKVKNKTNYVLRKVYAYQLKPGERKQIRKSEEASNLEFWPIEKLIDLSDEEKIKFVPAMISEKYLEFYKKISELIKKSSSKEVPVKAEEKKEKPELEKEEIKEEPETTEEPAPEKKGFFKKAREFISTKKISTDRFEELFWELEMALLENNVSVEVIEKIKNDLKEELVDKPLPRNVGGKIEETLKKSLEEVLDIEKIDLIERAKGKKPFVIAFFGINGSGKTTTIAKIAHLLKEKGMSSVLAAGDTFRAAAIDQLEEHANNLGIKIIKHDYGADAAAVAFDAVKYADKSGIDAVLIDTAGRLHSDVNLMDELKKIVKVVEPDLKIFVGESITGNDCVEQASRFDEHIGIDGLILTKADVDEKGGAALSVSFVTEKPILFIGTGQEYGDLKEFNSELVLNSLGLK